MSTRASAEESKSKVLDVFDATTRLLGGDWVVDAEDYERCTLPSGEIGAEYVRQVGGPGLADLRAEASQVAELWEGMGYHGVIIQARPGGDPEVRYPKDQNRVYLRLHPGTNGSTLQATGGCVRGDAAALSNALQE